jgi:hypothetical protein
MRKIIALAIATVLLAVGFGLWSKSTDEATGSVTSSSVSTMELHRKIDPSKLPDTTVVDAF